jgi:hypothetical protein
LGFASAFDCLIPSSSIVDDHPTGATHIGHDGYLDFASAFDYLIPPSSIVYDRDQNDSNVFISAPVLTNFTSEAQIPEFCSPFFDSFRHQL